MLQFAWDYADRLCGTSDGVAKRWPRTCVGVHLDPMRPQYCSRATSHRWRRGLTDPLTGPDRVLGRLHGSAWSLQAASL